MTATPQQPKLSPSPDPLAGVPRDNKLSCSAWRAWLRTALGRSYSAAATARLAQLLPDLFGYHLVQVGALADSEFLSSSRIHHRVRVSVPPIPAAAELHALPAALPFAADAVDVLLLLHHLETAASPHQVLREAERVLIGEGHIVIVGFNPLSWFGLRRVLSGWRGWQPWRSRFYGEWRVRDWLKLLGFELVWRECFYFRLPLNIPRAINSTAWLEKLGAMCWPRLGGAYVLVAKKRVECLTPIRMQWTMRRRQILAAGISGASMQNDP